MINLSNSGFRCDMLSSVTFLYHSFVALEGMIEHWHSAPDDRRVEISKSTAKIWMVGGSIGFHGAIHVMPVLGMGLMWHEIAVTCRTMVGPAFWCHLFLFWGTTCP